MRAMSPEVFASSAVREQLEDVLGMTDHEDVCPHLLSLSAMAHPDLEQVGKVFA